MNKYVMVYFKQKKFVVGVIPFFFLM